MSIDTKLEQLFADSIPKLYAKGATIICANQDPEGIMLIDDGIVEQYDVTATGNKLVVNRFKPKAFFPMSWAINRISSPYFYSAATNVSVRRIPADTALAFIVQNPDIALDLLARVYRGTDGVLRRFVLASCGTAADRVAHELLNEAYRFGRVQTDPSWRMIQIKQQNIAERSGLARETVSRELHKLRDAGFIVFTRQGLTICVEQLESGRW